MTALVPVIRLAGISKAFGQTKALSDVSVEIRPGEMVGLIGHNGAGKSTTMRMIAGEYRSDSGTIHLRGKDVSDRHTSRSALRSGIKTVYQELDLPGNLKVRETPIFAASACVKRGWNWRRRAEIAILEQLDEIFPGSGISGGELVERLSISQRQMIAIALAGLWAEDDEATCLILDEPTSSLDSVNAKNLYAWLRREALKRGLGVLVSTHKLNEVVGELDRAYVMVDGRIAAERVMKATTRADLVADMQSARAMASSNELDRCQPVSKIAGSKRVDGSIRIEKLHTSQLSINDFHAAIGEIVGLGGLEGQGQKELLRAIFKAATQKHHPSAVTVTGLAAFVSGDRAMDGIFPLWDVRYNMSISSLRQISRLALISNSEEDKLTSDWHRALRVKGALTDPIVHLSGGTQQKVLVGRALAQMPGVLLLDDPTRGVDEETKLEIYALVRAEAERGAAVLWYSTETAELHRCGRVCVLSEGTIADEILTSQTNGRTFEDRVLGASFTR